MLKLHLQLVTTRQVFGLFLRGDTFLIVICREHLEYCGCFLGDRASYESICNDWGGQWYYMLHKNEAYSLRYLSRGVLYCDYSAWVFSATLCCRLCPAYQFLFHPDSFTQTLILLCVLNKRVLSRILLAKQSKNVVFIFLSQHIL